MFNPFTQDIDEKEQSVWFKGASWSDFKGDMTRLSAMSGNYVYYIPPDITLTPDQADSPYTTP